MNLSCDLNGVLVEWNGVGATFMLSDPHDCTVYTMSMDIHGISAAIEYLGQGKYAEECWISAGHYMIPLGLWRQPEIDYWNTWVAYDKECADGKYPDRPVEPEGIEYWPYKD